MRSTAKGSAQHFLRISICVIALAFCLQGCLETGDTLSSRNAKKLIDLMAQTDLSLKSDDASVRLAHFASLAKTKEGQGKSYMEGDVSGLRHIEWNLRGQALEVAAELMFSNVDDVKGFREQINETFGAPDAACSDGKLAHWLPKEGLSVRFSVEPELPDGSGKWIGDFSVMNGDPVDVNCSHSSSDKTKMIDTNTLKSVFMRIKTSPPPLQQPEAMQAWMTEYGEVTLGRERRCGVDMYNHNPTAPGGFHDLLTEVVTCPGERVSSMSMESSVQDTLAAKRVRDTAEEVFGYSLLPCSHQYRDVWEISPQQTLEALYIADQVKITLYDGPANVVRSCKR